METRSNDESRLIIPIEVEAAYIENINTLAHVDNQYLMLALEPTGSLVPTSCFQTVKAQPGIHIHFILPENLRQMSGNEEESGEAPCREAPGIWEVVRKVKRGSNTVDVKRWTIYGDLLMKRRTRHNEGSPTYPMLEDLSRPYRYLGMCCPEGEEPEEDAEILNSLYAVLPGDPAFASYYPKCRNVFGMYDDLSGCPDGIIWYEAVGRYRVRKPGDPEYSFEGATPPIDRGNWKDEIPQDYFIALGSTSAEAYAAWQAYQKGDDAERLVHCFLNDRLHRLTETGGITDQEYDMFRRCFGSTGTEKVYSLNKTAADPEGSRLCRELTEHGKLLFREQELCRWLSRYLYNIWYRDTRAYYDFMAGGDAGGETVGISGKIPEQAVRLRLLYDSHKRIRDEEEKTFQELTKELRQKGYAENLMSQEPDPCYAANEPVFLFLDMRRAFFQKKPAEVLKSQSIQEGHLSKFDPVFFEWKVLYAPDTDCLGENASLRNWKLSDYDFTYCGPEIPEEKYRYKEGRMILTPHMEEQIEELVGRWRGEKEDLELHMLSQRMSGFLDFLQGYDQRLTMPVFDPEKERKDFASFVWEAVRQEDIKIPDGPLSFIRAGFLKVVKVRVIDVFGRYAEFSPPAVLAGESLRPGERIDVEWAALPPRLNFPARLRLCPGNGESRMLAGVIQLNHMEQNILCFDREGRFLGSFGIRGRDEEQEVIFSGPYGTPACEAKKELPQVIRGLLSGILSAEDSVDAYLSLRRLLEDGARNMDFGAEGKESGRHPALGRPVALMDVSLKLEDMAVDRGELTEGISTPERKGLLNIHFPIKLGNRDHPLDGLYGYIPFGSYENIFPPGEGEAELTIGIAGHFLLLCDPFLEFHVISGLLPPARFGFQEESIPKELTKLKLSTYAGPVLADINIQEGGKKEISLPCGKDREWKYYKNMGNGVVETWKLCAEKKEEAGINPRICEGWLSE